VRIGAVLRLLVERRIDDRAVAVVDDGEADRDLPRLTVRAIVARTARRAVWRNARYSGRTIGIVDRSYPRRPPTTVCMDPPPRRLSKSRRGRSRWSAERSGRLNRPELS
jgi:hypothetical protein